MDERRKGDMTKASLSLGETIAIMTGNSYSLDLSSVIPSQVIYNGKMTYLRDYMQHLWLAHESSPRPNPLRPCYDGQSHEVGDDGPGMVVSGGETEVRAERFKFAAELLVLRHDTLKLIDGVGPGIEAPQAVPSEQGNESKMGPEREAVQADHKPHKTETVITVGEQVQTRPEQETLSTNGRQKTTETVEEQMQPVKTPKCTFLGKVEISLKRFLASSTQLVECPDCGRTRTLSPSKGVLRFPSHDKRKIRQPNREERWVLQGSIWEPSNKNV